MDNQQKKKCIRCKNEKQMNEFLSDAGRTLKTCKRCRDLKNTNREKNKCIHNLQKSQCPECGGTSTCVHKKIKWRCKDCGGKSLCEHGKRKDNCNLCGGPAFCEHQKQKRYCKECDGSGLCQHKKIKSECIPCGGSAYCKHQKQKRYCKECGGNSLCEHQKAKLTCKLCTNPKKILIQRVIMDSRKGDKKNNRYDANNFIDKCFLEMLMEESMSCYYCHCQMQFVDYSENMCTIERLDNSIGHTKANCVLACRKCNFSGVGQRK